MGELQSKLLTTRRGKDAQSQYRVTKQKTAETAAAGLCVSVLLDYIKICMLL